MLAQVMEGSDNYPCVVCGSTGQIVRRSVDPRVKCTKCGFTYDASESLNMKEKGQIPEARQELQDPNPPSNTDVSRQIPTETQRAGDTTSEPTRGRNIPRSPGFVFLSKDRQDYEFCSKRDLEKVALRWQIGNKTYDVFQLSPKKVSAKLSIE